MATHTTQSPIISSLHRDEQRWRPENVVSRFDRAADMYYMYALPIEPAGGVYLSLQDGATTDDILLLVTEQGEIVGYQIENFASVWIKRHPEVYAAYREATRPIISRFLRNAWKNFERVMFNSLTRDTNAHLHHASA